MKVLSVFVCWNFFHYIRNTVESCQAYFPEADILVVDNGSTEPSLVRWLHELQDKGQVNVMFRGHNDTKRRVGSLYEGYNDAIAWALERNYDLLHLISDDVQFMWHDPDLIPKVVDFFGSTPDASNLSLLFSKRISPMHARGEWVPLTRTFRNLVYGVSDDGFFSAEFLRRTGFRFMDSENSHSSSLLEQGYHTYHWRDPHIAFVPWVATRRNGKIIGDEFPAPARYYMKPLSADEVTRLRERPDGQWADFDDWVRPWGWSCLTPYWATTLTSEYFNRCRQLGLRLQYVDENGPTSFVAAMMQKHAPTVGHVSDRLARDAVRPLVDLLGLRKRA